MRPIHAPKSGRRAAGERRPAKLEEAHERVEPGPELRSRPQAHDAAVDRLAGVERVADRLEIEDHLQDDRDAGNQEDGRVLTAAGPTSHSPPPIDVAAMIAPGPMTFIRLRALNGSGAGRSATSQRGNAP